MSPERVVFVLPSFAGGGAERVMLTWVRHLDRTRWRPELLLLDATGPLLSEVPADVPWHDLGIPRLRRALPSLLATLRRLRPAVVVSTFGHVNLALAASRPLWAREARLLLREANMPSRSLAQTGVEFLYRQAYRYLYRRADGVIATSMRMAAEFRELCALRPEQLHVLPNPVDLHRLRHAATPPQRIEGDGARFVAAGRLTRQKGFDRLLEWFALLPSDSHLTVLGTGNDRDSLQAQAARLGVDARVHFDGYVASPWDIYAGADAFLLPSRWEGLPNVALEALACGTPVIAMAEAGGVREIASRAPGAVTVADTGEEFIAAMKAIRPRPPAALRPSLLPAHFEVERVMADLESLLENCTMAGAHG